MNMAYVMAKYVELQEMSFKTKFHHLMAKCVELQEMYFNTTKQMIHCQEGGALKCFVLCGGWVISND